VGVPDDLPPIVGDPTQLHQVLLNLCVNARDAMPEGGTITISAQRHHDAGGQRLDGSKQPAPWITILVSDTGTGMTPEVVERIFEPFFTTKPLGRGTGLGLSTSLAIVKSHGGTLEVQSTPGRGSTFVVRLPAGGAAVRETDGATARTMPRGNGQLVLVVDDEAAIRAISRRTLEAYGYRVVLASNGHEALARFQEKRAEIALVITDMMMPSMDGNATMRALRQIDLRIPIIVVSGLPLSADGPPGAAPGVGATRHLAKPYTADELLVAVRSLVGE
jgi:CheY-like chemotaxis protein/anti-sigma regulatory factor (Ser/Thr protein kinase)